MYIVNNTILFSILFLGVIILIVYFFSKLIGVDMITLGRGIQLTGIFLTATGFILVGFLNKQKETIEYKSNEEIVFRVDNYLKTLNENPTKFVLFDREIDEFLEFTTFQEIHFSKLLEFYRNVIKHEYNNEFNHIESCLRNCIYRDFKSNLILDKNKYFEVIDKSILTIFDTNVNLEEKRREYDMIFQKIYSNGNIINTDFEDTAYFFQRLNKSNEHSKYVYDKIKTKNEKFFVQSNFLNLNQSINNWGDFLLSEFRNNHNLTEEEESILESLEK